MKPKVKDVYEPFNSLVRLVGQYGMVEVLASLAGIAEMVAQDQHEERKVSEAEWLRPELKRAADARSDSMTAARARKISLGRTSERQSHDERTDRNFPFLNIRTLACGHQGIVGRFTG